MMRSDQHKASTSTSWASASTHGRAGQPSEPNQAPMTPEKPTLRAGIPCQSVACATSEWLSSLAKFRPELEQLLRSCPYRKPTIVCLPDAECSGRKQSSSCTCAGKSDESFGVGRDGILLLVIRQCTWRHIRIGIHEPRRAEINGKATSVSWDVGRY